MIKRTLAVITAALLTVSLSACANSSENSTSSVSNTVSDESKDSGSSSEVSSQVNSSDGTSSESYADVYSLSNLKVPDGAGSLLKKGLREFLDKIDKDKFNFKYSLECLTSETDGKVRKAENKVVRDGDKLSSTLVSDDVESGSNKQIIKDNKGYEVNDADKTVTWMSVESYIIDIYVYNTAGVFYINELELCGNGKEKIGNKEYDYEEYKQPESTSSSESSGVDENQRARYYFDNGTLVGLKHINGDYYYTTMILELDEKISDGEFDYPSDYKLEERLEISGDSTESTQSQ